MTTATPGPGRYKTGDWAVDGYNMAAVIRKTEAGWETVARCPNENKNWRDDARLIAAAPAMLEALQEARRLLDQTEIGSSPQVDAAIALAHPAEAMVEAGAIAWRAVAPADYCPWNECSYTIKERERVQIRAALSAALAAMKE